MENIISCLPKDLFSNVKHGIISRKLIFLMPEMTSKRGQTIDMTSGYPSIDYSDSMIVFDDKSGIKNQPNLYPKSFAQLW